MKLLVVQTFLIFAEKYIVRNRTFHVEILGLRIRNIFHCFVALYVQYFIIH